MAGLESARNSTRNKHALDAVFTHNNQREKGANQHMPFPVADLSSSLQRVLALNGTDGDSLLVLYSLIEAYANARSPRTATLEYFGEKMNALFEELGRCDPEAHSRDKPARRLRASSRPVLMSEVE